MGAGEDGQRQKLLDVLQHCAKPSGDFLSNFILTFM